MESTGLWWRRCSIFVIRWHFAHCSNFANVSCNFVPQGCRLLYFASCASGKWPLLMVLLPPTARTGGQWCQTHRLLRSLNRSWTHSTFVHSYQRIEQWLPNVATFLVCSVLIISWGFPSRCSSFSDLSHDAHHWFLTRTEAGLPERNWRTLPSWQRKTCRTGPCDVADLICDLLKLAQNAWTPGIVSKTQTCKHVHFGEPPWNHTDQPKPHQFQLNL